MPRRERAIAVARELGDRPVRVAPASGKKRARWFAIGDPQASLERFVSVLDEGAALGDDGRLRPDVGLLSIGDHFDFGRDAERARRDGLAILHWLASHADDQVVLLAGNHDVARVMELACETDASFAEAQAFAREIAGDHAREHEFVARFPRVPTSEIAARDYSGFSEAQRTTVQHLLVAGRMVLAAVAELFGREALFVHAGVTVRELAMLGGASRPCDVARGLNRFLAERVARVAPAWSRGELAPLDLSPLHLPGERGVEGGGLLYHRAANLQREHMENPGWERDPVRPRRYDPRSLPRGVVQVIGHTSHKKCLEVLDPWVTERAKTILNGGLRTLRAGASIVYDVGIEPPHEDDATVYMIDPSMSDDLLAVPLLAIGAPAVPK